MLILGPPYFETGKEGNKKREEREELIFFNVGPPKEDIFSGHLLSPVFQSSFKLQLQISKVTNEG